MIEKEKNQGKFDKMNQTDNKLLASLLQRLQELDKENKALKEKLNNNKSEENMSTNNSFSSEPYLKIKELMLANQDEEQICTLCNCELNESKVVNLIKLYFCNNNCSLLMEKVIENAIDILRKK